MNDMPGWTYKRWRDKCEVWNDNYVTAMVNAGYAPTCKRLLAELEARKPKTKPKQRQHGRLVREFAMSDFGWGFPHAYTMDGVPPDLDGLVQLISRKHLVGLADMRTTNRAKHLTLARQEAYYIAHRLMGVPSTVIGRYFDRDHATVLHGVKRHEARLDKAKDVA